MVILATIGVAAKNTERSEGRAATLSARQNALVTYINGSTDCMAVTQRQQGKRNFDKELISNIKRGAWNRAAGVANEGSALMQSAAHCLEREAVTIDRAVSRQGKAAADAMTDIARGYKLYEDGARGRDIARLRAGDRIIKRARGQSRAAASALDALYRRSGPDTMEPFIDFDQLAKMKRRAQIGQAR
jgi:hypothetical protein